MVLSFVLFLYLYPTLLPNLMKKIMLIVLASAFMLTLKAQEVNKVIFDEAANQDILYGCCTTDAFLNPPFNEWFLPEHENYSPDEAIIHEIAEKMAGIEIRIVLGTWCGDSRREVPRFIRILELIHFPSNRLDIICVNRGKTAEDVGIGKGYVDFVPTFIVTHDGEEIGRIIEEPTESLEKDLLAIVKRL